MRLQATPAPVHDLHSEEDRRLVVNRIDKFKGTLALHQSDQVEFCIWRGGCGAGWGQTKL